MHHLPQQEPLMTLLVSRCFKRCVIRFQLETCAWEFCLGLEIVGLEVREGAGEIFKISCTRGKVSNVIDDFSLPIWSIQDTCKKRNINMCTRRVAMPILSQRRGVVWDNLRWKLLRFNSADTDLWARSAWVELVTCGACNTNNQQIADVPS